MTLSLEIETPRWANEISSNVSLIPLGRLVRLRNEKNDPIQIEQILSLTADRGVILYEDKGAVGNQASEDISRYSIVRMGDIVVNSMNVIIGSVGLSKYDGVLSPIYFVLTPLDNGLIDMRYLAYHFQIQSFQKSLIRIGYGILDHRMRIPWVNLKSELIAVPSFSMQKNIVDYLDDQISLINSLTLNFKKYLGLAEEALELRISEILKSDCKESSWQPSKISWSFKTGSGTTPRSDNLDYYDGDVMWVNSGDLNNGFVSTSKSKLSNLALEHFSTLRLYPRGTLLVAMYGATIGKCGILGKPACLNQAVCALEPIGDILPEFAKAWFMANKKLLLSLSVGGGQPNINQEIIRSQVIFYPSKSRQQEIVNQIAKFDRDFEQLSEIFLKAIKSLEELKSALITEVVSGCLPVANKLGEKNV